MLQPIAGERFRAFRPELRYERPDKGDVDREGPKLDPFAKADLALTRNIAAMIENHYPGHPWFIEVSHAKGIVLISIPALMPPKMKYVAKIRALKSDPGLTIIKRYCGEILERYRIRRGAFNASDFFHALKSQPLTAYRNGTVPV